MSRLEWLLARGRSADALELAERIAGGGAGSRLAVALPHARALLAQERLDAAADELAWAVEVGADVRAARDLALLRWLRLGDRDGARSACVLGLAAAEDTGSDPAAASDAADSCRVARYELTTLYLRLCPPSQIWLTLRDAAVATMPLPDRLLATGFAHALRGDHLEALRLLHGGLAREPYHPAGLYDYACVLAARGETAAAVTVLSDAVHNGEPRLADRLRHDPELTAVNVRDLVRRSHALSLTQIRPERSDHTVRLVSTADGRGRAVAVGQRIDADLGPVLRYNPESGSFELHHRADHSHLIGWELHNALRRIAPLVSDARWIMRDSQHPRPYVDECTITGGRLYLLRTPTSGPADVDDILRAEGVPGRAPPAPEPDRPAS